MLAVISGRGLAVKLQIRRLLKLPVRNAVRQTLSPVRRFEVGDKMAQGAGLSLLVQARPPTVPRIREKGIHLGDGQQQPRSDVLERNLPMLEPVPLLSQPAKLRRLAEQPH